MPTGLVDDAASPWDAADFAATTSSMTFFLAIVSAVRAASIVRTELRNRTTHDAPVLRGGRSDELVEA